MDANKSIKQYNFRSASQHRDIEKRDLNTLTSVSLSKCSNYLKFTHYISHLDLRTIR